MTDVRMPALREPDALEMIAASPATSAVAQLAGLAGGAAALLPGLMDALARGRQLERIKDAFRALDDDLAKIKAQVDAMNDSQYKVVAEAVSAIFTTVEAEKMNLLKRAVVNAVLDPAPVVGAADALGRLLRDVSVAEAAFMARNFSFEAISIVGGENEPEEIPKHLFVKPGSPDEIAVSGLISLGLLYTTATSWDIQQYGWTAVAAKLLALLAPRP